MKSTILLLPLLFLSTAPFGFAQAPVPTTESLIGRELATFDLQPFEWNGKPDPAPPRLGFYFNGIPGDSVAKITGRSENDPWFVIWHVMPHWSADEAGVLIGDTLIAVDGKRIGDENSSGLDYLDLLVKSREPGETLNVTVRRAGEVIEIPVTLIAFERTPMAYTMPEELGPIRRGSWLQKRLEEKGLTEWARAIARQMRVISDIDFSRRQFAGRPNPWRLNVVTALHNNPTRLGAYSRLIVDDLWRGTDSQPGLSGTVAAAARHLDIPEYPDDATESPAGLPGSIDELNAYLESANRTLLLSFARTGTDANDIVAGLRDLLDPNGSWETDLDSIADPHKRRAARQADEDRIAGIFRGADRVNFSGMVRAGELAARLADTNWLFRFAEQFRKNDVRPLTKAVPGVEGDVLASWETGYGRCIVGGPGPNRYTGKPAFILDLGGDDEYRLEQGEPGTVRFVADLDGDDVYLSRDAGQGAGIGCIDILVDVAGDDTYRADNCAQGTGVLGVGILADFAGDDLYTSHWCSQGAAFLGIGILYDQSGSDSYNADIYAQAFGYAKGFGALLDRGGNDSYRAGWKYEDDRYPNRAHIAMSQGFGFGMRPWTTGVGTDGGIGALSDLSGDDVYASDFFSQGGSYWYALGILHDGAGADRYTAGQYSQGSGIHLSFGALLDDGGDDMYDAYHGLEQGNAHDWSAGCLEDLSGNDTYRGSTASQGSALNVAFAWLLDRDGDDRYYVLATDTTGSQGGGNYNKPRQQGSLGMLLDFGSGTDYYTDPRVVPGELLRKGVNGFLFDDGGE